MKIYNNHPKKSYLKKLINKLSARRILFVLLLLLGLVGFGFASILFGAHLNSTGRTYNLKLALHHLSNFNFSSIPNTVEGQLTEVKQIDIDIKFKNWEKIRYLREKALLLGGQILEEYKEELPAKIRFNNQTYKVKIKLTGGNEQHINHPTKWSLMVKMKDGETIMGMNKFALLYPRARGYLTDWMASKLLQSRGIIGLRSGFSNVNINGKNHGLYYIEERFDEKILENNRLMKGVVFRNFGTNLKIYDYNEVKDDQRKLENIILLKKLWQSFLSDSIKPEQLFDLKKYASLYVISDIMYNSSEAHALFYGNSRMYFNPITQLIEPIPREWGDIREDKKKPLEKLIIENRIPGFYEVHKRISDNLIFKELYFKEAENLSKKAYLDSVLSVHKFQMDNLTSEIYNQNPFYKFPLNILYENQNIIRKKLHPTGTLIEVFFDSIIDNNSLKLQIRNKTNFPLEIKSIIYNNSKIILPDKRIIVQSKFKNNGNYQSINFPLKFNNEIDISKFSSDSLEIVHTILGIKETNDNFLRHTFTSKTIVFPKRMNKNDYLNLNPTKRAPNIEDFSFLSINKEQRIIEFPAEKCDLKKDLIIPEGYSVTAKPGSKIDLTNSARIISYSPILFFGNSKKPITITSSDSTGQGIVVLNTERISELSHVNIKSLSNISDLGWILDGVITFYESPVNINNCNFNGNIRGVDYLNIIRTSFNILNSTFQNTYANSFNSDFSTGKIENVTFDQIGKDAIKAIGSELQLKGIQMINLQSNGINGGQNSSLICENITINGGKISILSKDNTSIEINNIKIDTSDLAYCAFQEQSGYGPSSITIKNGTTLNVQNDFLVEIGSSLSLNGIGINKKSKKVKEILYGTKYTTETAE